MVLFKECTGRRLNMRKKKDVLNWVQRSPKKEKKKSERKQKEDEKDLLPILRASVKHSRTQSLDCR